MAKDFSLANVNFRETDHILCVNGHRAENIHERKYPS